MAISFTFSQAQLVTEKIRDHFNHHCHGNNITMAKNGLQRINAMQSVMRMQLENEQRLHPEKPIIYSEIPQSLRNAWSHPQRCKECGNFYKEKRTLDNHLKRHLTGKAKHPYTCLICNAMFVTLWNFTQHDRAHSGKKPYECNTCGMLFSRKTNLTRHYKERHGKKKILCGIDGCRKRFSRKSSWTRHQRSQHPS